MPHLRQKQGVPNWLAPAVSPPVAHHDPDPRVSRRIVEDELDLSPLRRWTTVQLDLSAAVER